MSKERVEVRFKEIKKKDKRKRTRMEGENVLKGGNKK